MLPLWREACSFIPLGVAMRRLLLVGGLLLAGCAGGLEQYGLDSTRETRSFPLIRTVSCEGPQRVNCKFINSPVKLGRKAYRFPDSPYPYYRTRNDLEFIDAAQTTWVAPRKTWTDGASIPPLFVPIIGDPRSREFMNAATVHDAYCAKRNEGGPYYHTATWQEVHRMFYDGLVASGTPVLKARIMYAAVYLGGPRWKEVRQPPRRQAMRRHLRITPAGAVIQDTGLRRLQSNVPLTALVPEKRLIAAFRRAKAHIEANNPSIDDLEVYLTRLELETTGQAPSGKRRSNFRTVPPDPGSMDLGGDGGGGDSGGGESGGGNSGGGLDSGG